MTLRVLAIDDSSTMRHLIRAALQDAGFQVALAVDGLDGLEKLAEVRPDVVITDVNMPNMDGLQFLEAARLRPDAQHLPILVLTTETSPDLKARARAAGAAGWIVKPFDEKKLVWAIERVAAPGVST